MSAEPLGRRRGRDPYANTTFRWYGADPVFQILIERNRRDIEGTDQPVRREVAPDVLRYRVDGLVVPGDLDRHDLTIDFCRGPLGLWALGIPACDYPLVYTSVTRPRKHENDDRSLCLWAPYDPPERRWWHRQGLHTLVEIVRRHLLFELHWWLTGGHKGGEWPVEDAPHGRSDVEIFP